MSRTVMEKLGFRPGMSGRVTGCPPGLEGLFEAVPGVGAGETAPDWHLVFAPDRARLDAVVPEAVSRFRDHALLWFAYPKLTGAIRSDLTRDRGWEALEGQGFLPVSQIAIDATWSALRWRPRPEIRRLTRKSGLDAGG